MRRVVWLVLGLALTGGCASEIGDDPLPDGAGVLSDGGASGIDAGQSGDGSGSDGSGGLFGNADRGDLASIPEGAFASDAEVTADAFFINDPPPPYCGPGGEMGTVETPGGTPDCPDDKNREGCPCPEEGVQAACWPGKRIHRGHGICEDGTTVCNRSDEFGLRWGPCEGYVLPNEDALSGPEACGCFSGGNWEIDNLTPCIHISGNYVYSSRLDGSGNIDCGTNVPEPPPLFDGNWSDNALTVDCEGQFTLCFTIKAGDRDNPRDDDCVLTEQCVDIWYPDAGEPLELPPLPHWRSDDTACAKQFAETQGYGEMSVLGTSIECDEIDDGNGDPYVFLRTRYCSPTCMDTPDAPGCSGCQTGGSGDF
ncbi:MAG: hypothetical protein PVI30_08140 [Myxococcales bacterium]|jgi:hypothetical protein